MPLALPRMLTRFINYFGLACVAVALLFFACKRKGKRNAEACNGKIRREVKLLTDPAAVLVDTAATFTTISQLGSISVPGEVKRETARMELEKKTYTVKCLVDKVDRERDGDYHLRLKLEDDYLIAEAANPECDYASGSAYISNFKAVYDFVKANELEGKEIFITGVAFVDVDHGYRRKQARNNLELHPILKIHF